MTIPAPTLPPLRATDTYDRFTALAQCSETPGSLTRTLATPAHRKAAAMLERWLHEAGLHVTRDGWGNVFGRTREAPGPLVVFGSHYDTVRNAGAFDGTLGILAALAAVETLGPDAWPELPFGIEVAAFAEEEGVRFPATFLGSRAAWGLITEADLQLRDADGTSLAELIDPLWHQPPSRYEHDQVLAYIEAHIEQGPVLESLRQPLATVSAIAGQKRFQLSFTGEAAHAGTCPMSLRRDALTGAAVWIHEVESRARQTPDLVATVGCVHIPDAAPNVVPARVELTLDLRHPDSTTLEDAENLLLAAASGIAQDRHLTLDFTRTTNQPPLGLDPALRSKLTTVMTEKNPPVLVSGAGHDAAVFAPRVPSALLFVRCRGGRSHHPEEHVSAEDFDLVVQTLAQFLRSHLPS
jgi:allantoate deiminase